MSWKTSRPSWSKWKARRSPSFGWDKRSTLSDTCTHRGGPLSEGTVEGAEVTCPWHGARFDIKTGAVMRPPAGREVRSYPVRVTGADIEIEV
jgi:nitrite reductase/ring-hydroxylating ferredoxin subunit